MASKSRAKLQSLLHDLDLGDSSAALPAIALSNRVDQDDDLSYNPDVQSNDESDDLDDDSTLSSEVTPFRPTRDSVSYEKYTKMEKRAMQAVQDYRILEARHQQQVKQSEIEVTEMRAQLQSVLHEMEERQRQVEAKAPAMRALLEDYRDRLNDLRISESQYQELMSMPKDGIHLLDQVKIAVYEQVRDTSLQAEQLRLALGTSRETASRAEEEAIRLRAESSRAAAALVEKDKEIQQIMESFQSRIARLSSELEQALIRAELNSAKGSMYDDLKAKTDRLEVDHQRLLVVEATFKRFEQQANEAERLHRQREHAMEMLQMDKAYLSKQAEFSAEQLRKAQGELEQREHQVQDLQRTHQSLYDRLVQGEGNRGRQDEGRLQKELQQLQASTHADLERIRVETSETYEREARLLREIRDQAVEEAARLRIAHSDLKDNHERFMAVSAEVQKRLESQAVELQSELRQKAFELGHLRVVLGEKEALLGHSNLQLDLMQQKMQVLRERCQTLEAENLVQGSTQALPKSYGIQQGPDMHQARGSGPSEELLSPLQRDKQNLQSQLAKVQGELEDVRRQLAAVGQPHSFLLGQLTAAKAKIEELASRAVALQGQLSASEDQIVTISSERDALRRDLDALLVQRGSLEQMKAMVMKAVGAGGSVSSGFSQPSSSVLLVQGLGTTTILGENGSFQ